MNDKETTAAPNRSNIELKARLADLNAARQIAQELATERLEDQRQIDTYFRCHDGRLKLREINGQRAELVWYRRPDRADAKQSLYSLVDVPNPLELKAALTGALGILAIVDKHREIYMYQNVRIHLDRVADLGSFLEFEAVLGNGVDAQTGYSQVLLLRDRLQIGDEDLLEGSYSDLILASHIDF